MSDLISRQAAIDALMEKDKKLRNINWYDKPYAEGECRGIDEALSIISNLPSAQPERKMGKWIKACGIDHACSVCQSSYMDYVDGWEYEPSGKLPNFCPNCGAKMEDEVNDDPE